MRFVLLICAAVLICNTCSASESDCSAAECINNGNTDRFTTILCNACIDRGLSNNGGSHGLFRHKLESIGVSNKYRKKFSDLNTDVLLLILEYLETGNMLDLAKAQSSPTVYAAVNHIFWRKYKYFSVYMSSYTDIYHISINSDTKSIYIRYKDARAFLKIIGSGIRNLQMTDPPADVIEFIYKYVEDSLVKLHLRKNADTFVLLDHPFKNVEELTFDFSKYNESQANQLPLNQQFPNLRNLTLYIEKTVVSNFNFTTFPNLEHLQLIEGSSRHLSDNQIEVILNKNPQIKILKVRILTEHVASVINGLMNLEHLIIAQNDITNNTRLENIKHLVTQSKIENINKLSCPQIIGLEMHYVEKMDSIQPWMEFLMKHQTLTHLKIRACYGSYTHSTLVMLTMINKSLDEVTIERSSEYYIKAEELIEILEKNQNIKRLFILDARFENDTLEIIQEKLGNDWNIDSQPHLASLIKKD